MQFFFATPQRLHRVHSHFFVIVLGVTEGGFLLPELLAALAVDVQSYSCAQLGYRTRGVKETAADSPLTQALSRCYQRIDKDKARGIITAEEQMRLRAKAEELYHEARTQPGMPYEAFNESLATRNLYPLCGVQRKSKPVGRPRKQK